MNKQLSKVNMKKTRSRNKILKSRDTFNKQCNYCVQLVGKSKIEYHGNLNEKNVTDSKTFWETVHFFFE